MGVEVLLVAGDANLLLGARQELISAGFDRVSVSSMAGATDALKSRRIDVVALNPQPFVHAAEPARLSRRMRPKPLLVLWGPSTWSLEALAEKLAADSWVEPGGALAPGLTLVLRRAGLKASAGT